MISIKDRTYVPIMAVAGVLSGKQNGVACPVMLDMNGNGSVMFVQAGVPVEDLTISQEGSDFYGVALDIVASGTYLRVFEDDTITADSFTFQTDYTFYCDAKVTLSN